MYKNYIFDCGNVLFIYSIEHLLDVFVGKDEEDRALIKEVVFANWGEQDKGLSSKDYYDQVIKNLPERLRDNAYNLIFHWDDEFIKVDKMHEFLKELKSHGKKIFLLSNMPDVFCKSYVKHDIFDLFDDVAFSYNEKVIKPDYRFYQILMDRNNLKANECMFVDDLEKNVKASKELGMGGYVFSLKNIDDFISYVRKIENF